MVQIICAGFQKTGTKSLSRALQKFNYKGMYLFDNFFLIHHAAIFKSLDISVKNLASNLKKIPLKNLGLNFQKIPLNKQKIKRPFSRFFIL